MSFTKFRNRLKEYYLIFINMDKPYYDKHYINNDPDIEYNHSFPEEEEEISRETMKFLLTLMIFMSCLPSLIQISKSLFKSCHDCYNKKRLPIRKIKSNDDLLNDLLENHICSICLEEYIKNDKVVNLNCNHDFHWECIKLWLNENNTCPQCREIII